MRMSEAEHRRPEAAARPLGWCGPASEVSVARQRRWARAARKDAAGYLATLAFLLAYALTVIDTAPLLVAALNVGGALTAAAYLYGKKAVPSVISNLAWVVITIVGLAVR